MSCISSLGCVVKGAHHIVIAVDEKFFIVGEDHFAATVFREEHGVADLD